MALTTTRIEGEIAKRGHLEFMKYMWQRKDPFIIGKHTIAICNEIDEAIKNYQNGISTFLQIKVPFRHGKSDMVSRYLPANFLGKFPDQEIIIVAYTASLARQFSRFSRTIVKDEKFRNVYPGIGISKEESSVDVWGLQDDFGKTNWLGLGGSVTGKGGSLIVIDDFFKNREEAESETIRDKVWESITDDVLTRCAPVCIVIILATHWHTDDPFGRIKEKTEKDPLFPKFKELKFPAWKMNGSAKKEYLFPERFSERWYESEAAILGPYSTAGLLLCEPTLRTGNLWKVDKIKIIDECPDTIPYTRGWDLASSEEERTKDDPDATVGIKLGLQHIPSGIENKTMPVIYIDDMVHGKWEAPERDEIIKTTALNDGHISVGIEAYGAYKDAYTHISKALKGLRTVKKLQLPGDKVAKWSILEPAFEAGNVYMRRAHWNQQVIDEIKTMLGGKHDDIPDAIVVAYETHTPHNTKLWPAFNSADTIPIEIQWKEAEGRATLHFAAMYQHKDLSIWVIQALWDDTAGKLFVYQSWMVENPIPGVIGLELIKRMKLREYRHEKIICNDRMFASEGHVRSTARVIKREIRKTEVRVHLTEAIRYDQAGAILTGTQMFALKQIYINESCGEPARQFAGWIIDKGKPSEDDCGYCIALCMILSELRKRKLVKDKSPKPRDYNKKW